MPSLSSRRELLQSDYRSGLQWEEHSVSAQQSRNRWTFRPTRKGHQNGTPRKNDGAGSLEELAIQSLLDNLDLLELDSLVGLPFNSLGSKLWHRIERENLTTPTVWAAFCRAFPEEDILAYYRAAEIRPQRTFEQYLELLTSPVVAPAAHDFCWLTALTISNQYLTHEQCVNLASLTNIVALDIHTSESDGSGIIDDRMIRTWSEHAATPQKHAFSQLQVLILRHQANVTSTSFLYFKHFPRLALFGVGACGLTVKDEDKAKEVGWTMEDNHQILAKVQRDIDMSNTWDGALYGCVRRSRCLLDAPAVHTTEPAAIAASSNETNEKTTPLLHYRLGLGSLRNSLLSHHAPLIFFRNLSQSASTAAEPRMTHASRNIWPLEAQQRKEHSGRSDSSGALGKKRKIKHQALRGVGEALKGFGMAVEGDGEGTRESLRSR